MNANHLASVEAYYKALGNKDLEAMARQLHPDAKFIGPLAQLEGKANVLASARKIFDRFNSLSLRAHYGAKNQVMVAYNLNFPDPIGVFRVAGLITFKEGLIADIELFYDPRPLLASS